VSDCYANMYTGTGLIGCVKVGDGSYCRPIYGDNDGCNTDADCFSYTNMTSGLQIAASALKCDNKTNTCMGISVGKQCAWADAIPVSGWQGAVCKFGSTCEPTKDSTYECTATIAPGASCQAAAPWCQAGYLCGNNGKCIALASLKAGDNCTLQEEATEYADVLCGSGMTCYEGKCATAETLTYSSCTADSDCNSNQTCNCSTDGKSYCIYKPKYQPIPDTGASEQVALANCLVKYNCSYAYGSIAPVSASSSASMSCAVQNCNSYLKKYNAFDCSTEKMAGTCFGYNPYCAGFPVWAIIVIVVVAVLLVLAVVFVIFLVLRKRRDYSSI